MCTLLPLPQASVASLVLWCFPWPNSRGAAYMQPLPARPHGAFAQLPLGLLTRNLQALMIHRAEVVLM